MSIAEAENHQSVQQQSHARYSQEQITALAEVHGYELSDDERIALTGLANELHPSDIREQDLRYKIIQSAWHKEIGSPEFNERNFALRGILRAARGSL